MLYKHSIFVSIIGRPWSSGKNLSRFLGRGFCGALVNYHTFLAFLNLFSWISWVKSHEDDLMTPKMRKIVLFCRNGKVQDACLQIDRGFGLLKYSSFLWTIYRNFLLPFAWSNDLSKRKKNYSLNLQFEFFLRKSSYPIPPEFKRKNIFTEFFVKRGIIRGPAIATHNTLDLMAGFRKGEILALKAKWVQEHCNGLEILHFKLKKPSLIMPEFTDNKEVQNLIIDPFRRSN